MTSAVLNSLRKHRNVSRAPAAPPAALLQGSSTSPPATLAHSYTPIIQLDHLLVSIKGDVQGLPRGGRQSGRNAEEANLDSSPQGRTLSLSLSLATLVTPTTSTSMQDNISLILPLVFHLASTHLGRDTQRQIHWSVEGPRGSETPTVGAPGRGTLRVDKYFPVEFQMDNLQQPLQPRTVLHFGSVEFMSHDGSYDMVLLPLQHDDIDGRRLARRGELDDTLLAGGGGDGATVARQEAAPRWLLDQSEPTTPAPLRGTCRVLSSHLRQRQVSLPSNMPTLGGLMTPAPLRGTRRTLVSHLR
jgi:hypothetical protein